jgi:hypothetical protein
VPLFHVVRNSERSVLERVDGWFDQFFFAGWEVSVLVIPALWLLLSVENQVAVSLSALTALVVISAAVGTLRGGYVGDGRWPNPGHLGSLPVRSAYYSLALATATFLGVEAQLSLPLWWVGIAVPAVVAVVSVAFLPHVVRALYRVARWTL